MSDVPRRVRVGSDRAAFYDRREDLYALQNTGEDERAIARVRQDARTSFAVFKGPPPSSQAADDILPVYSAGPNGPLAIPTGRVFVRFKEGVRAEDRRDDLAALGFNFDSSPSYAPNAAWVSPVTGGAPRALERIPALETLRDVVHVEPHLLLERARKGQ